MEFIDLRAYLKKLSKKNKDTKKFFKAIVDGDSEVLYHNYDLGYSPETIEELSLAFMDNRILFETTPAFPLWAYDTLKKKKK